MWEHELRSDSDREFLLPGIKEGFRVTDRGSIFLPANAPNNKSAIQNYKAVEEQIYREIDSGAYICVSDEPIIISPFGCTIKSGSKKVRVLHDCSLPCGKNLNSYASKNAFKYITLDRATKFIPKNGYITKVDIQHAFRSVGIHKACIDASGLQWIFQGNSEPTNMVDTRLMFGGRKSPEIFQQISDSVVRMMKRRRLIVLAYLDDFLVIGRDYTECSQGYNTLIQLLQQLGFDVNMDKCVPPCQKLTYLGVEICTVSRTLGLNAEKTLNLISKLNLQRWQHKKSATKRELQQLIGKLNWAPRVIRGGRTFLRRLIDLMGSVKRNSHHVRLNGHARADLAWWAD